MLERRLVERDANATAAAAGAGLQHHWKADPARSGQSIIKVPDLSLAAGNDRHARRLRRLARRRFVAHGADGFRRRPDEDKAGGADGLAKRAFSEEIHSLDDGAGAGLARRVDDSADIQIAFCGLRRTDVDGFVGHADNETVLVRVAEDGDGTQAELFCGRTMRTAISPRLATRSLSNTRGSRGFDDQDGLSRLDRCLILDEEAHDLAAGVGMDFGELFHHLDQADDFAVSDPIAVLLVGRLFRRRPPIKNSGQRT